MDSRKRVRVPDLREKKRRGEKIAMLTAYDATMAHLFDRAGIDVLLVGDSLGNVIMGCETTIPVTIDVMVHHTRAVSRGAKRALVVADMPFLTYQVTVPEAVRNAGRLIQEGGAAAVKMEGGQAVLDAVGRLVEIGIPVMGHLGLTPQSVHKLGGYRQQARAEQDAGRLIADARALEQAGAFAVVLESIPDAVAAAVTESLAIPTIGIGAGPHCDGQVLVSYDAFGLYDGAVPPFVKQYARLGELMTEAAAAYAEDVREGRYPAREQPARELSGAVVK
ncbi:MAG: 3-methyl-2-oxobutanoate hydroxymethyltransferase [Acidobacteriota bacterium]